MARERVQEQFVTLRLLINYALFKNKLKLFIVFVDLRTDTTLSHVTS